MVAAGPVPSARPVLRNINRGRTHADGFHLPWHDEVAFDLLDGGRIVYTPGPAWTGTMPAAFFGSVVALTLAWRGALPLHASAVEHDGCAVLIAGTNGAGKSTLTAQLLGLGLRLVGDDLTLLDMPAAAGPIVVRRGRPTIRLHRDTAATVAADLCKPVADDVRGKWLVRPSARTPLEALPLAGVLLLGQPDGPVAPVSAAALLAREMFRPQWMRALPGQIERLRGVFAIASRVPVHGAVLPERFYADPAEAARLRRIVIGMTGA